MNEYLPAEEITDKLIEHISNVCICYDYPIVLGKVFQTLIEKKVEFTVENFSKFYMYLDSIKTLRPDAIKFL